MGCGCLLGLFTGLAPRIVLAGVWYFTDLVGEAFSKAVWPLAGLVFLPFATLAYVLVFQTSLHGPSDKGWLVVLVGLLLDLGSYGGHARTRRRTAAARPAPDQD